MKNVKLLVKEDELVIRIKLTERSGISRSGKSVIVASTAGNIEVPGHPNMRLGLNLFEYPPREGK